MQRRRFLLACGSALLAGCSSGVPSVDREPVTPTPTPPETITECRDLPDPPADVTRQAAREFVTAYERAFVANDLIAQHGGPRSCPPEGPGTRGDAPNTTAAVALSIQTLETAVVAETAAGLYLVSTCEGSAEYWCTDEGRVCSHSGRNAAFVTHFVGEGRHVRVPHNWTACSYEAAPYTGPDPAPTLSVPEGESGLRLRVYDFGGGETPIPIELRHRGTGDVVLDRTADPPYGPAVYANVAVRTGPYRLVAGTGDGRTAATFDLAAFDDPDRNGVCVYRGPGGTITITTVATAGVLAPPTGVCTERYAGADTTAPA